MTTEKQRGYSLGYAAGRKRLARDFDRQLASAQREDFRQRAALVALTALMQPGVNWGTTKDGVHTPYRDMAQYSRAAFDFADYLVRPTSFDGLLIASGMSAFGQDPQGLEAKPASPVPQGDAQ